MSDKSQANRFSNSIILALIAGLLMSLLTAFSPAFGILTGYLLGGGEFPLMTMLIAYVVSFTLAMALPGCLVITGNARARHGRLIALDFFAVLSAVPLGWFLFAAVGVVISLFPVTLKDSTWPIYLLTTSFYITAWFLHGRAVRFLEVPIVNLRREWMTMTGAGVASILSAIVYAADMWVNPPEPNQFFGPFPSLLVFGLAVFLHVLLPMTAFVIASQENSGHAPDTEFVD